MGLDMYLSKSKFFYDYIEGDNKQTMVDICKIIGIDRTDQMTIKVEAIYWRKANAIHKWFVDNCQEGIDDCREVDVSREDLIKLHTVVTKQLAQKDKKNPKIFLQPQAGFFFGGTDIDEYYWQDLQHTKDSLEREIKFMTDNPKWYYSYHSSW